MGRCGMNNSDPASAEEKTITEDDAAPAVKVATRFLTYTCRFYMAFFPDTLSFASLTNIAFAEARVDAP